MQELRRRRGPSKGDLREQAILETARRLVAALPLSQITIDELASGAGISRSSFYFYFDSKHAVIAALLRDLATQLHAETEDWFAGSGPDDDSLRRALAISAELWRDHWRLLRQALLDPDPEPVLGELRTRIVDRFVGQMAARIERDRIAGLAPPAPPETQALARALVQLMSTALSAAAETGDPALADGELVETLTTVLQRTIYAR
jgi:AcrR family transcriptional regulator